MVFFIHFAKVGKKVVSSFFNRKERKDLYMLDFIKTQSSQSFEYKLCELCVNLCALCG